MKYDPISLEEIEAARERISKDVLRTPLVKLNLDDTAADIYLKLENLQPIGSFKIRGASNALKTASPDKLKNGVWTISAGNHGQGLAWAARKLGVECTVLAAETTARTKIDAMKKMGAKMLLIPVPKNMDEWKEYREDPESYVLNRYPNVTGKFVPAASDPAIMAGQGTIGLEIFEDLPDVDVVLTPYGGGGLSCGVASAFRALKPEVKLYGCVPETGTALAASFAAGKQVYNESRSSFVEGAGSGSLFPEMWDLARILLDGAFVVSLREVCDAIRLLATKNHIIAEGAGAVPVAAALSGKAGSGKIVCVISGGNIDLDKLVMIFQGKIPV